MTVKDLIDILDHMPHEAEAQTELGFPVETITVKQEEGKQIVKIS